MSRIVALGDLNLDVFARAPSSVEPGGERRSTVRAVPGGSAGTFARVAADEGADVSFIGCVGTDLIGDLLIRSLRDSGVDTFVARIEKPSGTILALEQGDERTMVCSRGANDGLNEASIPKGLFADADHLHVSGYMVLSPRQLPAARYTIELARQHDMTVSLDPPPANLIASFGVDAFLAEIADVDWFFPNLAEGRILTGSDTPDKVVGVLSGIFSTGALTLGPSGALAWGDGERDLHEPKEIVPGNPTGAGDAFAAAFVVARLAGRSLSAANARACVVAAERIRWDDSAPGS